MSILDQRSQEHEVFNIRARRNELSADSFRAVRSALLDQTRRGMGAPPWALCMYAALLLSLCFYLFLLYGPNVSAIFPILLALGLVVTAYSYRWRLPKAEPPEVRNALLDSSLCPCCAYDLRALPEEPDGCRVCPECGAAWSLRQRPPEPPSAAFLMGRALSPSLSRLPAGPRTLPYALGSALRRALKAFHLHR